MKDNPSVGLTFLEMDFPSLNSVNQRCDEFTDNNLNVLMCNAGIMYKPPCLSNDYEITFATNHLQTAFADFTQTAEDPDADERRADHYYRQSKLANIVYDAELARRYLMIMEVSVHLGVVHTDLTDSLRIGERALVYAFSLWTAGTLTLMEENQACLSQLWIAAGASRD
ncbi:hypothetical protein O1611_g8512 [Lasiodiplodia mahajangana]|uniref:Uncharacterized protein n=1 Tax=Lasiodiplodia mahajangana TaxID=1108764 RepID=A0ACC2JD31_9PEZI|nr:hypothetical protein O1611_g8512 [Lasiodiplodia mahajangana]